MSRKWDVDLIIGPASNKRPSNEVEKRMKRKSVVCLSLYTLLSTELPFQLQSGGKCNDSWSRIEMEMEMEMEMERSKGFGKMGLVNR